MVSFAMIRIAEHGLDRQRDGDPRALEDRLSNEPRVGHLPTGLDSTPRAPYDSHVSAKRRLAGVRWITVGLDEPRFVDERDGAAVLCRRAPGGDGGVDGVAFLMSGCSNPDCDCTEVTLTGFVLDERSSAVGFDTNGKRRSVVVDRAAGLGEPPPPLPEFSLTLDLSTGEIASKEEQPPALDLAWLTAQMDGALLDRLWVAFLARKGIGGVDRQLPLGDIGKWEPGEKAYYFQVFGNTRPDCYRVGGRRFDVIDAHCVDPGCGCDTAILGILEAHEGRAPVSLGHVAVPVSAVRSPSFGDSTAFREIVPGPGVDRTLLEEVYRSYRKRYPSDERLRTRMARVRAVMRPIALSAAARRPEPAFRSESVGRNDPCPCGSGKKFKKCCGSAASSR
jgi:hypothetical protein